MIAKNKQIPIAAVIIGALLGDILLLIPEPLSWAGTWCDFHVPLAALTLTTALDIGGAILFLKSLSVYKADLRRAYKGIAISVALIALGSLQLPIVNGFDLWSTPWVRFGGIGIAFFISSVALFVAARTLARLVGVRSVWIHPLLAVGVSAVSAGIIVFVPHAPTETKEIAFDISNATSIFNAVFTGIGAWILFKVSHLIGNHYARAMQWLFWAILTGAAIPLVVVLHSILTGAKSVGSFDTLVIFLVHGSLSLIAGYLFARVKEY